MQDIYVTASNIISPLGQTTQENFQNLINGESGVDLIDDPALYHAAFQGARLKDYQKKNAYTKLESLFIDSIQKAIDLNEEKVNFEEGLLILSSTKGNIDLLKEDENIDPNVLLGQLTQHVQQHFGFKKQPIMVSNACISGVLAINMGARLIASGKYKQVVVSGGDLISEFVTSGFSSLMAISPSRCKPYDLNRDGINMGEACATMILSNNKAQGACKVLPGYSTNDANHISGPSRTGDGLYYSIQKTLDAHGLKSADIDFINAHGTATLFNDDMESKAFKWAQLDHTPINSFKAFLGHTLGAAGIVESILSIESMEHNTLIQSLGLEQKGTAETIDVIEKTQSKDLQMVLKTASGFGGCNASVIFQKDE